MKTLTASDLSVWSLCAQDCEELYNSVNGMLIFQPQRHTVEITVSDEQWLWWTLRYPQYSKLFSEVNYAV